MGRRALRQVDPSLDIAPYLCCLEDLPKPLSVNQLFERVAPLEIEVGSGKGLFLTTAAAEHPGRNFLGIELAGQYAKYSAARLARRQLVNAKMVCGDAVRFFHEWIPSRSAVAVHVYFPDPWWKKRHRKRRVMQTGFLQDIERVLQRGGRLHFWTDVEAYFEETLELISEVTALDGPEPVPEQQATHDLDYRTHFERRMRLSEQAIHRAVYRK